MKRFFLLLAVVLAGCGGDPEADAYGHFEATEVTVAAQTSGQLLRLDVDEGDRLDEGEVVGVVDTAQLVAQREALLAQQQSLRAQQASVHAQQQATLAQGAAARSQVEEARAQAAALAAQLATAREELARTERLYADEAATARERNQRQGEVAVLEAQVRQAEARVATVQRQAGATEAQAAVAAAQASGAGEQAAGLAAQLAGIEDRLRQARLTNPVAGTVLAVLARRGEVVQPGSPLYTVADLDTLRLRAYATGDQLPRLRLGAPVAVRFDDGAGGLARRAGTVTWVAAEAEFTPNTVQTRDARADLVYAFDVRVPNADGRLKVGMPGEVAFSDEAP